MWTLTIESPCLINDFFQPTNCSIRHLYQRQPTAVYERWFARCRRGEQLVHFPFHEVFRVIRACPWYVLAPGARFPHVSDLSAGLGCTGLLNVANPVDLTMDGNGVVTAATINTQSLQQILAGVRCSAALYV